MPAGAVFWTGFEYDALNRLKSARETYAAGDAGANSAQAWKQTNVFDRWGNRTIDQSTSSTTTNINRLLYGIETSNNQLQAPAGSQGSVGYDAVGNMTGDTHAPAGIGFEGAGYDAENKMTEHYSRPSCSGMVCSDSTSTVFDYDGNGRRVQMYGANYSSTFVYGVDGSLVYEWGGGKEGNGKDHAYLNGELLVTADSENVRWLVKDQLGTPRIVMDKYGDVTRHDYLPFGEELNESIGWRTGNNYGQPDGVRQQFTGYERDVDTGLDFAQARYYANAQGRFTSPDEFTGGPDELFDFAEDASDNPMFYADFENPQSLNKYQYTYNNPVNMTDPDGHCPFCIGVLAAAVVYILTHPTQLEEPPPRQTTTSVIIDVAAEVVPVPVGRLIGGAARGASRALSRSAEKQVVRQIEKQVERQTTKSLAAGSRTSKVRPDIDAKGRPHSVFKKGAEGRTTGYTTYNKDGNPVKRFRPTGKPHGEVKPPLILEPKPGKGPGSPPKVPRPANPDEIPHN